MTSRNAWYVQTHLKALAQYKSDQEAADPLNPRKALGEAARLVACERNAGTMYKRARGPRGGGDARGARCAPGMILKGQQAAVDAATAQNKAAHELECKKYEQAETREAKASDRTDKEHELECKKLEQQKREFDSKVTFEQQRLDMERVAAAAAQAQGAAQTAMMMKLLESALAKR
ncbi:hypothetical protein T492DRAFT_918221 [Pavlovales sp. CCMP2436]|nr:hypothetical protein T492DRAFT_918221 [Pavlovales sp. CCMP2436]